MTTHNADIVEAFNKYADLLDIEGANPFRVRAYRNAARVVSSLPRQVAEMVGEGADLSELPGIGEDLAAKMKDLVSTGTFSALKDEEQRLGGNLAEMLGLGGLGPKRVKQLHDVLGISTLSDLREAAVKGTLKQLPGFGPKTTLKILIALRQKNASKDHYSLPRVEEQAHQLTSYLQKIAEVKKVVVAGSCRRQVETVRDLDILVTARQGPKVMDHFVRYEDVRSVISKGDTRSTVVLRTGMQVDLRVVPAVSYGAALTYFTGSKAHNIALRKMALKKGLKINEYGVFRGSKRIAGKTEEEVYASVGLPYIEPELREDRGEIEAARDGQLPKLITLADIKGDLHLHSRWSDGQATLRQMAEAAMAKGYRYMAITDHSPQVRVARGLNARRLRQQMEEVDRLNEEFKGFTILKGSEVDILEDGSLDFPEDILRELDLTVCSIHSYFNLSAKKQTDRLLKAMDNPYCRLIGHPTGRLVGVRPPYKVEMERLIRGAKERGKILEINSQPDRLDLSDVYVKMAVDEGVLLAINTDAHMTQHLDFVRYGVMVARRGWATAKDVVNTRPLSSLKKKL